MKFGRYFLILLSPASLLMIVFLTALGYLGIESIITEQGVGLQHYQDFFSRKDYVAVLFRTLNIALITTIISLLIGYPAAYTIAKANKWRNTLMLLVILPWLVSLVVRTYGWVVLLGNRGTFNSFLIWLGVIDSPIRLLFNQTGVVIGLVHVLCPFMIFSIVTSLMHIEKSMDEAAMMLGANPMQTFLRVTAPLTLPGIVAGSTLVFLLSTGAIITPLVLGGPRNAMLATQIYQEVFQLFDFPKAATMAFILMACAAVVIVPLQLWEKRVLRNLKGAG